MKIIEHLWNLYAEICLNRFILYLIDQCSNHYDVCIMKSDNAYNRMKNILYLQTSISDCLLLFVIACLVIYPRVKAIRNCIYTCMNCSQLICFIWVSTKTIAAPILNDWMHFLELILNIFYLIILISLYTFPNQCYMMHTC